MMRPGILYAAIFSWAVCTVGGRLKDPFLYNVAQFNKTTIDPASALQILFLGAIFASDASKKADELELQHSGQGRLVLLMVLKKALLTSGAMNWSFNA